MESSNFQPPVRRSLSNEELEARVNQAMTSHSGVESVMELLVAQEALRAQEDQDETAWIESMRADGSPEALAALQAFQGFSTSPTPEPVAVEPVAVEPVTVVEENTAPEPVVEPLAVEPQTNPTVFTWLNPAPSAPVVPEVPEVIAVEQVSVEEVVSPVIEETQPEPFSWFTNNNEQQAEPVVVEEVEVVEEVIDLVPVGSESETEFEKLLAAAAAEEELTALEEKEIKALPIEPSSNVLIPSDEHRNRGPLSQLWVWLGLSATVVPVLLTWTLIGLGLNATAIAVSLAVGYLASGTLIAVAAIAGKRSGLSTAIISRSVFGVWGNSIPLAVVFISRLVITAVILGAFTFLMNGVEARLPEFSNVLASFAGINVTVGLLVQAVFVVLLAIAVLVRGNGSRVIQVGLSLLAFVLVAESFVAIAGSELNFVAAGTNDAFSLAALSGISLVIMVNLTLFFALAPNISKAIPMKVRGVKVFSAVLVANFFVPVAIGVLTVFWLGSLSTSGLMSIQEAVTVLPFWAQGTLVSGASIAIIFGSMLSLRTATLDAISLFRLKSRGSAVLISSFLTLAVLVLFAQQPKGQEVEYLANVFVVMGVLTAGWIGIFAADVAIRRQAYHELSLSRSYGLYKKFNFLALVTWVLTLVFAVAVMPVNLLGFDFMGFLVPLIGLEASLGSAAVGFVATVVLGMVLTLAIRIPQIRNQEREVLALESRREQLNDIFLGTE
jgi:purine-cytosine permease-like protein